MKKLITELKSNGIVLVKRPIDNIQEQFHLDCPKEYCKSSRSEEDNSPLLLEYIPIGYFKWRCRHCLWSGHVGEKPKASDITESILLHTQPIEEINSEFGFDTLDANADTVIMVMRKEDAVLLRSLGFTNILSIPHGGKEPPKSSDYEKSPDRFYYLASNAGLIMRWKKIIMAFDDSPDGLLIRQGLSKRLGQGRCYVAAMSCGTLQKTHMEHGPDAVCADINEATAIPIFGLYSISDFEKDLLSYFERGMSSGVETGWKNVDRLYTVVPGQLTVVTGIPNSGKSEWVDALTLNLAINHGWRFAAFSPENGKEAHATKLIEKRVEMSADPKDSERMSYDTFCSGAAWVDRHYCFIESKDEMPTLDWILERAADAVLRFGIRGLIIDPWNRIEKKLSGVNETDYVAASIPKILRFLINYDVHGWLVVHPKQQTPDHKTKKISAPSLYDMAGSAHFVNMCDNGIVIHRSDSIDDTTEVHVKKVRFKHVGRRGETKLSYNIKTGRYTPLDQSPKYTYGESGDGIETFEA